MFKKLMFAVAALTIAAPALADRDHDDRRGYRERHHPHWNQRYSYNHHARPVVVMPPPHVYYAPPPQVYYAPPPAPVYYAPPPAYRAPAQSGVSIRFHLPL